MTKKANNFTTVSRETLGQRWAALLRRHYPVHATKNIARDFKCEISTAKAWLSGQAPQLQNFIRAAEIIGMAAVLGVLFPDTEIHQKLKLHDDLRELRSRLDRLSLELRGLDHDCKAEKNTREDGR